MRLGTLKQVDLREYWKHEALDFTRWLSEEENIAILSEEIGIEIEVLQTEASVGRFNVDILAQEENTDRKIIIENQLEMTDHSHLGQLITYAAGLDAEYVIWIVRQAREEHRQAVDWLNQRTDGDINFFECVNPHWPHRDHQKWPHPVAGFSPLRFWSFRLQRPALRTLKPALWKPAERVSRLSRGGSRLRSNGSSRRRFR